MANGSAFEGVINAPALTCSISSAAQPWLSCGYRIGSIIGQLITNRSKGQPEGFRSIDVETRGPDVKSLTDGLLAATVAGFLSEFCDDRINMVNALSTAQAIGLHFSSKHEAHTEVYKNEISVSFSADETVHHYKATVFHDTVRIVQIDDYYVEIEPTGKIIFLRNLDRPGVVAFVGKILAENNINISFVSLGRSMVGKALTIFGVDSEVPPSALDQILAHPNIEQTVLIHVREP